MRVYCFVWSKELKHVSKWHFAYDGWLVKCDATPAKDGSVCSIWPQDKNDLINKIKLQIGGRQCQK